MRGTSGIAAPASWAPLVVIVTLVQAVMAAGTRTLPLFGIPLTQTAGMPPEAVGQLASATSFGSMMFFLWGPVALGHLSSIRQLQLGCAVAGLAVFLCLTGRWEGMLLAALVIGIGYGPSTPAGSALLMRAVPARRRATIFSIKQAGVPLGGFAAGLLLPAVALLAGGVWAALVAMAMVSLATAAALRLWKGDPDRGVVPTAGLPRLSLLRGPLRMFAQLFASRRLRLITAAGFALGVAQGVVMGFFPVFLADHVGYSIAAAGAAFALLQGVGIFGRVIMGWLSDRLGDPVRALAGLCLATGVAMALLASIGPDSSVSWVVALSAFAGMTVVSWNGVFLTGLAEAAPDGQVGEVTSAGTFVLFSGYVLFPLLFQLVFSVTDGYATGLILSGLAPAGAGITLYLGMARRRRAAAEPEGK